MSKHPVSLEDLLHVKRAERPAPEFWTRFDQELRQKQLAALVEKRPWWRGLPRVLRGVARYHLPLGATAVLAVTLLTLREYQPVLPSSPAGLPEMDVAARDIVPDALPVRTVEAPAPAVAEESTPTAAATPVATIADAHAPGDLARIVHALPDAPVDDRPSSRSIEENRVAAAAMLGTTNSGFEARALPARFTPPPAEPLARMSTPSDTRRSRFADAFAAAAVGTSPVPTTRVARRLSDEQLYDTIHRFGASGNSVSIRF